MDGVISEFTWEGAKKSTFSTVFTASLSSSYQGFGTDKTLKFNVDVITKLPTLDAEVMHSQQYDDFMSAVDAFSKIKLACSS